MLLLICYLSKSFVKHWFLEIDIILFSINFSLSIVVDSNHVQDRKIYCKSLILITNCIAVLFYLTKLARVPYTHTHSTVCTSTQSTFGTKLLQFVHNFKSQFQFKCISSICSRCDFFFRTRPPPPLPTSSGTEN